MRTRYHLSPCRSLQVFAIAVLTLWLSNLNLFAQSQDYDCGNENEQTCKVGQMERYNMRLWTENPCEYDLKAQDGICVNDKRRLLPVTGGWLGWAMQEQRYRISQDEPINRVTWLGSHNAFAATNQGFNSPFYTNHVFSITDQLNWGARHLELDPHFYDSLLPFREPANRLCHASSTFACVVPGYGQRLLGFALREIDTWLAANPSEVVVVKLNDKNALGPAMREEIHRVLGHRLMVPPTNFQRWPTMREIRATGRQVLFMQHDEQAGVNPVTWNAKGLVLANNWPNTQDFVQCTDSEGQTPLSRAENAWWDVAEGRSRLNGRPEIFGEELFDSLTGSFEAPNVRAATNCGVAIIGLDFINSLWSEYNVYAIQDIVDRRHAAHIWNWRENDFGGNASFEPSDRRWVSRPAQERLRLVCSPVRDAGVSNQHREWRITAQAHPWSRVNGDAICQAEFGAPGTPYHFAFPATGFQNRTLGEYLQSQGVTEAVWLGYTTGPQDYLSVQPGNLTVTMPVGGPLPAPEQVQIVAPRGAALKYVANQPWLVPARSSDFVPADATNVTLPLLVTESATELAPGNYAAELEVMMPAEGGRPQVTRRVGIKLRVLAPTTTTLSGPATVPFGSALPLTAAVLAPEGVNVNGTVEVVRVSPGMTTPDVLSVNASNDADVEFFNVPPGVHQFYATFLGTDQLQPSESQPLQVEVTSRIGLAPRMLTLDYIRGGALPTAQLVQVSSLAPGAAITPLSECTWLSASIGNLSGPNGTVTLQPQANIENLLGGDYACRFEVTDSLSSGQDAAVIDVSLRVRAVLQATPNVLPDLLVGSLPARTSLIVSTLSGDAIPLRYASTCPEVASVSLEPTTVANVSVLASRGTRAPGVYACQITIDSDFATQPLVLPVNLQVVNPTVINSNPPGLSYLVDGQSYTGEQAFTWQPGTVHQISTTFEQSGGTGTRYRFQNWSSGPMQTQSITADANGASYTVNFRTEHLLTRIASPAEGGTVNATPFNVDGFYEAGTQVQLSASAASGFQATGFTGGGLSFSNNTQATVTMSAPRTITANFAPSELVPITIQTNAPNGTVQVNGATQPLPVTLLLEQGRSYRFVAPGFIQENPASEWVFTRWVGATGSNVVDYVVTSQPATLEIVFRRQILYSFTASPAEGGTITNSGWQLAVGQIPIEAIPAEGFRFVRWSGDLAGQPNPVTVNADRPLTATAEFAPLAQPSLMVIPSGQRTDGTVPGTRRIPLRLSNRGTGAAGSARITGIGNIRVLSGTGLVSAATPLPIALGAIAAGGAANFELQMEWPATARRVQLTVFFDAGDGVASGSTTLNLFR